MPEWMTLENAGVAGTFVFGFISLLQFIFNRIQKPHLRAAQRSVAHLRSLCVEHASSIDDGGKWTTKEVRQFLTDIAFMAMSIEDQIGAAIGEKPVRPPPP